MIIKSKIVGVFCLCFIFIVNAQAALEVLQNPYNMEIAYYQTAGLENWSDWDTDTLETAYDAGQVTMTSGTVDLGNKLYAVDGLAPDYGSVLTTTMKLASGAWINYKFNADYTGGRTLGSDTQNTMRVNTFYHEDMQGFHYRLLYSTTDAPNTFNVLVEVRDLAVITWKPRTITYDFGENSTLVRNVDTIRYEELHTSSPGAIVEFNVNLILEPVTVQVDMLTQVSTVPSLYNVGYNGWGDITNPLNVNKLNELNVKHMRMFAMLNGIFGSTPNDPMNLDYAAAADGGVGFADRINLIMANGWTPLIAISIHGGVDGWSPVWFYGERNDSNGDAWTRYNSDGTKSATIAGGSQIQEMSDLCRQIAAGLAARGITGLLWETIGEAGHELPLPAIHYNNASGIRQADATAKFMGPATWPNWTVEEFFLKPYLLAYGADLLDYVSVHWYSNLNLFSDIITMADTTELSQLMDITPTYAQMCKGIKAILDNPLYNPSGKQIGIVFSEYDATSKSAFSAKPGNIDWPDYRADADNYINTNYFGGVWCASTLCHMANSDSLDIAFKFQTIDFYGLLAVPNAGEFYRTPLWYAWKLLQTKASLVEGSQMFQTQVITPLDSKVAVFAAGDLKNPRIILINRSFGSYTVDLTIEGLGSNDKNLIANRYIFNEDRSARFIGPLEESSPLRGEFEYAPADSLGNIALERVDDLPLAASDSNYNLQLECGPISITVLQVAAVGDLDTDGDVDMDDFPLLLTDWVFEKENYYIENHSFELPDILDGYSYSIAPDSWVKSGYVKLYDPSQAQWDTYYSQDINSTLTGGQIIYATGGGIYQDTGIVIQPNTVYEVSVDTGLPMDMSGDELIKFIAVDGAAETDLLTVIVDSSSDPAGQGSRLIDGLWITQTVSWDSADMPAVTGQSLRVYVGGNQIHLDNIRVGNGDCRYDLNDDNTIDFTDFSEFSKNWMREIGDNL